MAWAAAAGCRGVLDLEHPTFQTDDCEGCAGARAGLGNSGQAPAAPPQGRGGGAGQGEGRGVPSPVTGIGGAPDTHEPTMVEAGRGTVDAGCRTHADCATFDSAHCAAECVEGAAGKECALHARDDDADGYGAAACGAAPGSDCDDARGSVYPLAEELCDGLDNDCDTRFDFEEGHRLGGRVEALDTGVRDVQITWSSDLNAYAVLTQGTRRMRLSILDRSGAPRVVEDHPDPYSPVRVLAASGELFGLLSLDVEPFFVAFDSAITLRAPEFGLVGDSFMGKELMTPQVVSIGSERWLALWVEDLGTRTFARRVSAVEAFEADATPLGALGLLTNVVSSGDKVLLVGADIVGPRLALVSASLDDYTALVVPDPRVTDVVAGANASGFALAGRLRPDKVEFFFIERGGALACRSAREAEGFVPTAVAGTSGGSLLMSRGARLEVMEMREDCSFGRRVVVHDAPVDKASVASAFGAGYAVTWIEAGEAKVRAFGANFCDEPR